MQATAESVRAQILAILGAWGMPPDLAETTAEVMTDTDLAGIDSHGISMLPMYEMLRHSGQLRLDARPRVERDLPSLALVDGCAGLGHPAAHFAMQLAVRKAREAGIGAVVVRNSHHFGAAGWYARLAAAEGCLGLVTSSARTLLMVPTRGTMPVLGTNPIAFAAPAGKNPPVVVDIATTTVAGNKVKAYALRDKTLPEGWVVDEHGASVTDPHRAMSYLFGRPEGGITPLGGTPEMASHKGYGLALMSHLMSATLAGAAFAALHNRTRQPGQPDDIGHFMLALDPRALRPESAFEADVDEIIEELRATPPANPEEPVLIPGDPEMQAREERLVQGIPIPPPLEQQVRDISGRAGVPFLLVAPQAD